MRRALITADEVWGSWWFAGARLVVLTLALILAALSPGRAATKVGLSLTDNQSFGRI